MGFGDKEQLYGQLYFVINFEYHLQFWHYYRAKGASQVVQWERIFLQCRRHKKCGFSPWVRKIAWSRKWQPTPVSWLGKFHGQKSLAGYSPWGLKESDMTWRVRAHTCIHTHRGLKIKIKYSFKISCIHSSHPTLEKSIWTFLYFIGQITIFISVLMFIWK